MLRGDAHQLYLQLKQKGIKNTKILEEVTEIRDFYQSLECDTLRLIYYRMVKEKNGSGIIPLYVSAIPWLFFLFSSKLEKFLFHDGSILWMIFGSVYLIVLVFSVIVHYREKAWAAFHMEIIKDILHKK